MKIAIPLQGGQLAAHFGHCQEFAFFDVSESGEDIPDPVTVSAPPHEPGLLPKWLAEHGADVIIAGGMGRRAQSLFEQNGIEAVVGVTNSDPATIVSQYLQDSLSAGENLCDH